MKWKEAILNLKPYQPGRSIDEVKRAFGLEQIIKLASNENPFGCSAKAKEVIRDYPSSLALYPDGRATALRNTLAKHLNVKNEELIFGNGSDEIIQVISRSLLYPGVNTVMAAPTFPQYKHNAMIEGAEIREVALIDGAHNLSGMLEAIDEATSIVWVCSPNNPTGLYVGQDELLDFLGKVPEEVLVVLDEAYFEYAHAEDYPDTIKLLDQYKNLIVLRTFSKIYGLASFRVGYGVASEDLIRKLDPAREPFNTNTLGQFAAAAALGDQAFIKYCHDMNKKGLDQFYDFCEHEGLQYYPSQGNFILIDVKCQGDEVFQHLMEKGYIVRSGNALGFPTAVRITVGSHDQNHGVIEELRKFLHSRK